MKHRIDVDEDLLQDAMRCLNTGTIKATIEEALSIVTERRRAELQRAFDRLAELAEEIPLVDRFEAW